MNSASPSPDGDTTGRHPAPRPWLAALLSLLQVGAGHVYADQVKRGVILAALWMAAMLLAVLSWVWLRASALLIIIDIATALAVIVGVSVWSYRVARKAGPVTRSAGWRLGVAVALIAGVTVTNSFARRSLAEAFRAVSDSMRPAIMPDDHFIVTKIGEDDEPRRGRVGVFVHPKDDRKMVARVIAVAGDKVHIEGRKVKLNGEPLTHEPCATPTYSYRTDNPVTGEANSEYVADCFVERLPGAEPYEVLYGRVAAPELAIMEAADPHNLSLTVPDGHFFVLGDNRDNAEDSRQFGVVSSERYIGTAVLVFWRADGRLGDRL